MEPVYLDNQATTVVDPRVVEAMMPYFSQHFGNPHSAQHSFGWDAARAVEAARAQVAALIGARASEVVFTSGATEANNQAILGVARAYRGTRRQLITTGIEHPCVSAPMALLATEGFSVDQVNVDADGRVDLEHLRSLVGENTLLVSIMAANNEIGVTQDLASIGAICAAAGTLFHTDAAQAAAKLPLDVDRMHIDLLGLTGHKLYGPMGCGALYVRAKPGLELAPLLIGGGQEHGLRSGTVAAPLAVGLGKACEIGLAEMTTEGERLTALREHMLNALRSRIRGLAVNGHPVHRLPGNLNVRKDGVAAVAVIDALEGVALSSASACAAGSGVPSHVLDGIGLPPELAQCCIRIGLGRFTTREEVDFAVDRIAAAYAACEENATPLT